MEGACENLILTFYALVEELVYVELPKAISFL